MYRKPSKEAGNVTKSIELVELEDDPVTGKEATLLKCKTCPETFKMLIALNKHECKKLEQPVQKYINNSSIEMVNAKQEFVVNQHISDPNFPGQTFQGNTKQQITSVSIKKSFCLNMEKLVEG